MAIFRSFAFKCSSVAYRNRFFSSMSPRGLVLGVYSDENDEKKITLTPFAKKYDESTSGQLLKLINIAGPISSGSSRILWGLGKYDAVAVAGLGKSTDWHELDCINGQKENVRIAAAAGAKSLLSNKVTDIEVEDLGCAQSAAEGATLGLYKYQASKAADKRSPEGNVRLAEGASGQNEWVAGSTLAKSQNWARFLMDSPANLMTPTIFAENVKARFANRNITVNAHDKKWAEEQKMGSFLSVSQGSAQPPVFLEITYNGAPNSKEGPVCLVGKGITFDSGGISIKPSANMDAMRADMGGAACVVGAIDALAASKVPVNVKGFIPLCENLPSDRATKPGDVVFASNGKSICVDNTDAEGRLVLCDALCYSAKFNPKYILDIATLTGAIVVALGDCVAGVYSTNQRLWNLLEASGSDTGDRVWRMPLFKHYTKQMTDNDGYDINNLSKTRSAGSCTAAAFLREFVPKNTPWIHVDMAGVMGDCSDQPYIGSKGMSGRPTRTLVEFIRREINDN